MSWYIHSTCGQPQVFKFYKPEAKGSTVTTSVPLVKNGKEVEVAIGGGAYVLMRDQGKTRKVVITEVSDEELALLHSCDAYLRMKERGFFTERHAEKAEYDSKGNPSNMEIHDNTAQIDDHDHAKGTDARLNHGGTRAVAGLNNQFGGEQPLAAETENYGQILI